MLSHVKCEWLVCSVLLALLNVDTHAAKDEHSVNHHSPRESVALRPDSAELQKNYDQAVSLYNAGQFQQARTLFEKLAAVPGGYRDSATYLARLQKQLAQGTEYSRPAADLLPNVAQAKGGQAAPSPAAGGLSNAERVSRVLLDGRKAYQEGQVDQARARFQEALQLDSSNAEARRFLSEIERKSGGQMLAPSASAELRPASNEASIAADFPLPKPNIAKQTVPALEQQPLADGGPARQQMTGAVQAQVAANGKTAFDGAAKVGTSPGGSQSFGAAAKPKEAAPAVKPPVQVASVSKNEKQDKTVAAAPVKPVENKPADKPAEAKKEVVKTAEKAAEPKKEIAKPADKPQEPKKEIAKPADKPQEPKKEIAKPADKPQEPKKEIAKPADKSQEPKKEVASAVEKKSADRPAEPKKEVASAVEKKPSDKPKKSEEQKQGEQLASQQSIALDKLPDLPKENKTVVASVVEPAAPKSAVLTQSAVQTAPAAKPVEPLKQEAVKTAPASPELKASDIDAALSSFDKLRKDASEAASENAKVVAKVTSDASKPFSKIGEAAKAAAEKPAPTPTPAPTPDPAKENRAKAEKETENGIKLYNEGRYAEALVRFEAALSTDSKYEEAQNYKSRSEKKLDENLKKQTKVLAQQPTPSTLPELPPLTSIESSEKTGTSADKKADSINLDKQAAEPKKADEKPAESKSTKTEAKEPKSSDAKPATELRPLTEAVETPKPDKKESTSADPKVQADNLLRDAQKELKAGNRSKARDLLDRAAALDPENPEVKAKRDELAGAAAPGASGVPLAAPLGPDGVGPKPPTAVGVDGRLAEARRKYEAGRTEEALAEFQAVLEMEPDNPVAKRYIADIDSGKTAQAAGKNANAAARDSQQAEGAFQKGLTAYESGRLDVAVQWCNYALTLDPNQPRALQYLQQTGAEYEAWVQQHQHNAIELQREVNANEKLDTLVNYDSQGPKSLVEFLNAMSLLGEISFYVAEGVDPELNVTAKIEDTPLNDALDIVLLPIGLKWTRSADVITITTDLRTKFFNLTPEQVGRMKTLLEDKTLPRYLYGPEALPPMRNVELTLDDRENILIVTDTQENINKIEAFLKDMQLANPPGLIYKSWKIRPEEGQKIKALVQAIVKVQSDAPYDLDRKVVIDGDDLIVKDTADNVAKIEQLLLDKNFLRKLETQKLNVVSFNLTPREPIQDNLEQVRDLANNIVTVVKTILYSQSTESAAAAEGRRYWYDPNTLQLTIVDYPENLRVVGDYIRSLPMLNQKMRSEIIFLKHQTAGDLSELLQRVLGLGGGGASEPTTGGAGQSVTKTLRVEGEMTLNDLTIRVRRINENNAADENDDNVELIVQTRTTSEDRSIEEFRIEFIEDYKINVIEVRPSGTPGEGSARIEVTYDPLAQGGTGPIEPLNPDQLVDAQGNPILQRAAETTEEELTVDTVENMNALLIRYSDPGDLSEVRTWIEQLDIPVLQVNIETKLVEVNETRAKEWMPEFNILNLQEKDVNWGEGQLDARFAQYTDEWRDPFDPFPENKGNTNLLKGTTVLNFLATAGDTPLNFTLRMLESEGVVNVVNGPHVLVENGETAEFEINRVYGDVPAVSVGGANIGVGQQITQQTLQQVAMSVTPNITQLGEIRLEIENLELRDFGEEQTDEVSFLDLDGDEEEEAWEPQGVPSNMALFYNQRQRTLQTVARVHNGGTIVLGGWNGEHTRNSDSGVPILRNIPYIGKLLFARSSDRTEKTTLLIFLTCHLVDP